MFVLGITDCSQIGQQVADFTAVKERLAANECVFQAGPSEFGFEQSRLLVCSKKDGEFSGRHTSLFVKLADFADDRLRFGEFVGEFEHADVGCRLFVCPEGLLVAALVVLDQLIGDCQNSVCAAVVVFQPDNLGFGKVMLEIQDVCHFRTTPAVNRLVIIANDQQVPMWPHECFNELELNPVGGLVLVDLDMVGQLLLAFEGRGLIGKELHREQQEIVEIEGSGGSQTTLILAVGDRREKIQVVLDVVRGVFREDGGRFPTANPGEQVARRHRFFADANVPQGGSRNRFLVSPVVDCERRRIAEQSDFAPQNSHAQCVECRNQRFGRKSAAQQVGCPLSHFT